VAFFDEKVTSSWLEGEYLRGSLSVVLRYTPSNQKSFLITENQWIYNVNYYSMFPYNQPCQRDGWMIDSSRMAPPFVVGDPRFQVDLLLCFSYPF
jgi:hypothetical protein